MRVFSKVLLGKWLLKFMNEKHNLSRKKWFQSNMVRRVLAGFLPLLMVLMGIASVGISQKDGRNSVPFSLFSR